MVTTTFISKDQTKSYYGQQVTISNGKVIPTSSPTPPKLNTVGITSPTKSNNISTKSYSDEKNTYINIDEINKVNELKKSDLEIIKDKQRLENLKSTNENKYNSLVERQKIREAMTSKPQSLQEQKLNILSEKIEKYKDENDKYPTPNILEKNIGFTPFTDTKYERFSKLANEYVNVQQEIIDKKMKENPIKVNISNLELNKTNIKDVYSERLKTLNTEGINDYNIKEARVTLSTLDNSPLEATYIKPSDDLIKLRKDVETFESKRADKTTTKVGLALTSFVLPEVVALKGVPAIGTALNANRFTKSVYNIGKNVPYAINAPSVFFEANYAYQDLVKDNDVYNLEFQQEYKTRLKAGEKNIKPLIEFSEIPLIGKYTTGKTTDVIEKVEVFGQRVVGSGLGFVQSKESALAVGSILATSGIISGSKFLIGAGLGSATIGATGLSNKFFNTEEFSKGLTEDKKDKFLNVKSSMDLTSGVNILSVSTFSEISGSSAITSEFKSNPLQNLKTGTFQGSPFNPLNYRPGKISQYSETFKELYSRSGPGFIGAGFGEGAGLYNNYELSRFEEPNPLLTLTYGALGAGSARVIGGNIFALKGLSKPTYTIKGITSTGEEITGKNVELPAIEALQNAKSKGKLKDLKINTLERSKSENLQSIFYTFDVNEKFGDELASVVMNKGDRLNLRFNYKINQYNKPEYYASTIISKGERIIKPNTFSNIFTNVESNSNNEQNVKVESPVNINLKQNDIVDINTVNLNKDINMFTNVNIKGLTVKRKILTPINTNLPISTNLQTYTPVNTPINIPTPINTNLPISTNLQTYTNINVPVNVNTNFPIDIPTPINTSINTNVNTNIETNTNIITPNIPIVPFGFNLGGRKEYSFGKKGRKKTGYSASFDAIVLGIYGKKPNKTLYSGQETRPMLINPDKKAKKTKKSTKSKGIKFKY